MDRPDRRHGTRLGRQLYPNQSAALAKAKLFADLPIAYQYLTDVSTTHRHLQADADDQRDEPGDARLGGSSGASNVDVYAQTRADIQTERTYSSIANNAMKWVPLLNVVLTVFFYALFPVLFRSSCCPRPARWRSKAM